jgi:hypothetical protein
MAGMKAPDWWLVIVREHIDPAQRRIERGPICHDEARRQVIAARALECHAWMERRVPGQPTRRLVPV